MATPLFDLVGRVIVTGVDQFNASMNSVEAGAMSFAGRLNSLGKSATATGAMLTRNLTLPIVAMGGAVIKMGADFEQAMDRSLSIVKGVTAQQRKEFEQVAIDISKSTTFSAKEVAEAYKYLASAGLDASQILASIGTVAQFAEAGQLNLAQATEQLTDVLGAFGLAVDDATQYQINMAKASDLIAKADSIADATIEEFTAGLMKSGGVMHFYGQTMEETIALLAAFATTGLKGVNAGEALTIIAKDMAKSAKTAKSEWAELGISVYDSIGEMRPIGKIIEDLNGKLKGLSTEQKVATLASLDFRQKSVQFIQRALAVADSIQDMRDGLKDYSGFAKEVAAAATAGFWAQLKILGNQATAVALILYQSLGPVLKNYIVPAMGALVSTLAFVANAFNSLPGPVKEIVFLFIAMLAAVGPVYLLIGAFAHVTAFLIPIILSAASAIGIFISVMVANPIIAVAMAIGLLVYAGFNLIRQYGGIGNAWAAIWEGIKNVSNKACRDLIDSIAKTVEATLREFALLGKIPGLGFLSKAMESAISGVEKLRKKFDGFFGDTATKSKAFANTVNSSLQKASSSGSGIGASNKDVSTNRNNLNTMAADKRKFEADWNQKAFEATHSRLDMLRYERDQALAEARKLGASRLAIMKYYAAQERQLQMERIQELVTTTQTAVNNIMAAWSDYTSARIAQIDNQSQREIKAIQDSNLSEEEKARRIAAIENRTDAQRRDMQRKQAIREKALAIFNAVINAAVAYVKALTLGPIIGWIMAGLIAASAGIQIALIAAKPIPFAKGGLVKGGQGGIHAIMGEGNQDELVLPIKSGVSTLVDALIEEVSKKPIPRRFNNMAMYDNGISSLTGGIRPNDREVYSATKMNSSSTVNGGTTNLNVGVLVANDAGIKELERKMQKFRIAENQRKGFI